jgi:hypothetical protein
MHDGPLTVEQVHLGTGRSDPISGVDLIRFAPIDRDEGPRRIWPQGDQQPLVAQPTDA